MAGGIDAQATGAVVLLFEDETTIRTLATEEMQGAGYRAAIE